MLKLFLISLISLNLYASDSWEKDVNKLLPMPLSAFPASTVTLKEVEAKLGKADLVEGAKYYWIKDGLKYAIELTFTEKKVLSALNYTFTKSPPSIESIKEFKFSDLKPFVNQGKVSNRYFALEGKRTRLVIDPVSKTLYSVRVQ